MIEERLGLSIDIHGGGQDLIYPHHENEIAQGTCAHDGELYCRFWVHNGFVTVEGRKMSKSFGNEFLVRDLLNNAPGEAIRFALSSAHCRQSLDWSAKELTQARRGLDRLYGVLREIDDAPKTPCVASLLETFEAALEDDLNFPAAIAELFRLAHAARQAETKADRVSYKAALRDAGGLLGLLQQAPSARFWQTAEDGRKTLRIEQLTEARMAARSAQDFDTADRIREDLSSLSVTVQDRADGSAWQSTR